MSTPPRSSSAPPGLHDALNAFAAEDPVLNGGTENAAQLLCPEPARMDIAFEESPIRVIIAETPPNRSTPQSGGWSPGPRTPHITESSAADHEALSLPLPQSNEQSHVHNLVLPLPPPEGCEQSNFQVSGRGISLPPPLYNREQSPPPSRRGTEFDRVVTEMVGAATMAAADCHSIEQSNRGTSELPAPSSARGPRHEDFDALDDEVPRYPHVSNVDEASFVRMFNFRTCAVPRNVSLTHTKAVWTLYLDGRQTASESHHPLSIFLRKRFSLNFSVDVPGAASLNALLSMTWNRMGPYWHYELHVNDVFIPARWTKSDGPMSVTLPEVVHPSTPSQTDANAPLIELPEPRPLPTLEVYPQGPPLSYHHKHGGLDAPDSARRHVLPLPAASARDRDLVDNGLLVTPADSRSSSKSSPGRSFFDWCQRRAKPSRTTSSNTNVPQEVGNTPQSTERPPSKERAHSPRSHAQVGQEVPTSQTVTNTVRQIEPTTSTRMNMDVDIPQEDAMPAQRGRDLPSTGPGETPQRGNPISQTQHVSRDELRGLGTVAEHDTLIDADIPQEGDLPWARA